VRAVAGRGEQGEQQIHRAVVHGPVGHRRIETDEHGADVLQPLDAGVRHGDARSQARRAQGFAFQQGVHHPRLVQAHGLGRGLGDDVQRLTLRRRAATQDDAVPRQQFTDVHAYPDLYPSSCGAGAV